MLLKAALAAAVLLGLMGTAVYAKPRGLGFGGDCGTWSNQRCFGAHDVFQWREDELGFRTSCVDAREIVRDRGYRKVRVQSCGVRAHHFTGLRGSHRYLIKVNGYNGDIWSIQRID